MADMEKLNPEELGDVAGGRSESSNPTWKWVTVSGTKNYLAIRSKPEYNENNEIAKVHNGDRIQVRNDLRSGSYVWVYAANINTEGWVNGKYLK